MSQARAIWWPPNGTTVFTGIGERMSKERTALAPLTMKIKVVAPPVLKHPVYIAAPLFRFERVPAGMDLQVREDESGLTFLHGTCPQGNREE